MPVWLPLAAAGIGAGGSIASSILGADAQQGAINSARADQTAALRQQQGIADQQLELARPLINVRDGVLGVLAQRFGIAAPRPALTRSAAEGTALIPLPGVTAKDRASGGADARTPVYFDPVNQNFTTQTGAVLAPFTGDGRLPFTEGKNNAVEVRNGQIVGVGSGGVNQVMAVPDQVPDPSAAVPGGAANALAGDVNGNQATVGAAVQPGVEFLGGSTTNPGFAPSPQVPAGNLFDTARGMVGGENASGVGNDFVSGLIRELEGMTGEDQLAFERAEAERGLERLFNARGLRNSGRELSELRERDSAIVGARQDQRISNLMQLAALAGSRADTGYAQTRDLASFLAGRDDQGFNRDLTTAQFGANRLDRETADLFALAGLGASGTAPAFNAGVGLGGAYANQGNVATRLALQGGNAQASMFGGVAGGLQQGLFDFVLLNQAFGGGDDDDDGGTNWVDQAVAAGVS